MRFHFPSLIGALCLIAATPAAYTPAAQAPPQPLTMHWSHNSLPKEDPLGMAGDSLKILLFWRDPVDSATAGRADSTLFTVTLTKAWRWHGGQQVAANVASNRRHLLTKRDSLMLAKPIPGDSVTFKVTNFRQCRKGACSVAGMGVATFRSTTAPPPATPSWTVTEF